MSPWDRLSRLKSLFWAAKGAVQRARKQLRATSGEALLSVAARVFRAAFHNDWDAVCEEVGKCPRLEGCCAQVSGMCRLTPAFFRVWQELSMSHLVEQEKQNASSVGRKPSTGVASLVSKNAEPRTNSLDAIWDATLNKPCYTREEKVKLLDTHWAQVFGPKEFSDEAFETLVDGYDKSAPGYRWEVEKTCLEDILKHPKSSSPGPDGIPFTAYSTVHDISLSVLWGCTQDILEGNPPPDDFNFATLVLLPKKPTTEVDGTKWFSPKDTRPISIVNADNRIIANVFRKVLAGFAERVCSKDQRGFLNNRFLLENVVDIDCEARRLYLKDTNGALVLIDLSAAFPSISQEYLFNVLERQGVPVCFRNAIKCFYKNNQHFTKMDGEVSESFRVQSGVRQGCPMSPVLFALALGPF